MAASSTPYHRRAGCPVYPVGYAAAQQLAILFGRMGEDFVAHADDPLVGPAD
jgi:hypothetical protein